MFATSCIVVLVVSVILVSGSPVGIPKDRQDVDLVDINWFLADERHERSAPHSSEHLFDRITHEVAKGHVTSQEMHRWIEEINKGLHDGDFTTADVSQFVADLKEKVPNIAVTDWCCIFG